MVRRVRDDELDTFEFYPAWTFFVLYGAIIFWIVTSMVG